MMMMMMNSCCIFLFQVRYGQIWSGLSCKPASSWLSHYCWYCYQQNGSSIAQNLWPDIWSQMGHLDGKLCQWWRILSLLVLSRAWLWPYYPGWYIYSRLSAICRGTAVWYSSASEENKENENCSDMVPQIDTHISQDLHLNIVNLMYIFCTVTSFFDITSSHWYWIVNIQPVLLSIWT